MIERPYWATSEGYWNKQCSRLVATCGDVINGRVSVIETAKYLSYLRTWFRADSDPDFLTFTAIDSETDHLPVGDERKHWSEEALLQKDVDIRKAEAFYSEVAKEAAANLIKKYEIEPDPLD